MVKFNFSSYLILGCENSKKQKFFFYIYSLKEKYIGKELIANKNVLLISCLHILTQKYSGTHLLIEQKKTI